MVGFSAICILAEKLQGELGSTCTALAAAELEILVSKTLQRDIMSLYLKQWS